MFDSFVLSRDEVVQTEAVSISQSKTITPFLYCRSEGLISCWADSDDSYVHTASLKLMQRK